MLGCEGGVARARGPALSNKPLGDSLGENPKFDGNPSFRFFCGAQQGGKALWDYLAVQIAHKMRVNLMRQKRGKKNRRVGKGEGAKHAQDTRGLQGKKLLPHVLRGPPSLLGPSSWRRGTSFRFPRNLTILQFSWS